MARARTKRGRLRQVENWLRANHPTALPVTVRVGKTRMDEGHRLAGEFERQGDVFRIRVLNTLSWETSIESLIHEWAHVLAWQPQMEHNELTPEHPDEWGLWMARLYREFVDEGGSKDADEFPSSPWM